MIETLPATFVLGGEMQTIPSLFSLERAKAIPTVIAAGRAGGIVIVMTSRDLSITSLIETFESWKGTVTQRPQHARKNMKAMNLRESL